MDVRGKLESGTREIWERELQEANELAEVDGDTYKTEQEIKELAQNTLMRTIYPMLHTSFKLNWEFAEAHKETEGDLSGSVRTFAVSNVPFLLGILETLNRNSVIEQLKHIATIELPNLREKLKASLENAKNAEGGLPELIIQKAAEFLKGKRTISGALNMQAELLNKNVERLSSVAEADAATSFRLITESYVEQYMADEEVATRVEVPTCAGPQLATPVSSYVVGRLPSNSCPGSRLRVPNAGLPLATIRCRNTSRARDGGRTRAGVG